jgi:hypothetical protein
VCYEWEVEDGYELATEGVEVGSWRNRHRGFASPVNCEGLWRSS